MSENNIDKTSQPEGSESEMVVNQHDGAVVVDEKDRMVFLTETETIVVDKPLQINLTPSNRPRKVYGGMWGQTEIAVVAVASLALLGALAIYFFGTLPANRELERNRATRDRLERELVSAREKYGSITSTETQVAKLISSVDDFEAQYLPVAANGRTALYQRLNGLIAGYGLVNTSGPDYAPLEIADQTNGNQTDEERGRAKFRSLFPGAYVTMTLEGSYQNLRRFIRDIETGQDFIIISAVELEPSDTQTKSDNASQQTDQQLPAANMNIPTYGGIPGINPNQRRPQIPVGPNQQARPKGRTLGETVSLRMEMAAYFRRVNAMPTAETTGQ
jgi:hypothetical protein